MPGVGEYFVLPPFSAPMHASLMCSGVSKSGSPAAKLQTSSPAACRALALPSTASVGEGETLRAQVESGAGRLLMDKHADEKARIAKGKPGAEPARQPANKKATVCDRRCRIPCRARVRLLFFAIGRAG